MIHATVVGASASAFALTAVASIALAARICGTIEPFDDGPRPGRPPTIALVVAAAAIGAVLGFRGLGLAPLVECGLLVAAFVGSWYSDVRCGIVPDTFTLAPLAIVLALGFAVTHSFFPLVSAVVVFVPFAVSALLSRGRGMGWGDVKLVALGGAVLGMRSSVLALGVACLVAVAVALVRRRRSEPIAFAPYIVGAMATVLVLPAAL